MKTIHRVNPDTLEVEVKRVSDEGARRMVKSGNGWGYRPKKDNPDHSIDDAFMFYWYVEGEI